MSKRRAALVLVLLGLAAIAGGLDTARDRLREAWLIDELQEAGPENWAEASKELI